MHQRFLQSLKDTASLLPQSTEPIHLAFLTVDSIGFFDSDSSLSHLQCQSEYLLLLVTMRQRTDS
jgi:hypothetical protein